MLLNDYDDQNDAKKSEQLDSDEILSLTFRFQRVTPFFGNKKQLFREYSKQEAVDHQAVYYILKQ